MSKIMESGPIGGYLDVLGKLSWLWMNSTLHRHWSVASASRFILPPITLDQIHILERDGLPVAYCSWAWLSDEAEVRYLLDPSAIEVSDWKSGDRLWFADWVAPFSASDSWALRSQMSTRFPYEVARAIRVKNGKENARVMEFKGPRLPSDVSKTRLASYYAGFIKAVSLRGEVDRIALANITGIQPSEHGAVPATTLGNSWYGSV